MFSRKFDTVTGLSLPNNSTSKSPFEVLKYTNLLNFYLWYLVYINFGSGSNYFDKSSKSVEIKRKGLFKDVEVKLNFDEIKSVKLDISEGFNPRRRIALVLKGRKKPLPLTGAGELKPLLQVEEEGARLAKFLDVNLEGLK